MNAAGDNAEEDDEAEQDELLLECAGDVIPKFGSAITPADFVLYFPNILQLLLIRTVSFFYFFCVYSSRSFENYLLRKYYFFCG